jgi:hypothetical protein
MGSPSIVLFVSVQLDGLAVTRLWSACEKSVTRTGHRPIGRGRAGKMSL